MKFLGTIIALSLAAVALAVPVAQRGITGLDLGELLGYTIGDLLVVLGCTIEELAVILGYTVEVLTKHLGLTLAELLGGKYY